MTDRRSLALALACAMRMDDAERIAAEIYEAIRRRPDSLSLSRVFEAAGIPRQAADNIAIEIIEAIRLSK